MTLHYTLRTHAFTRGLSDEQIAVLASMASEVSFEENEVVLVDGERSRSFFLLVTGSVVVELRTPAYVVTVEALGPGQVFGWSSLLAEHDTLFQVRAREHTTAIRLDGGALKAACHKDTLLGTEVLQRALAVVAGRVKATEIRFAEMCGVRV
jgi:CRP-like cAMP-binding protein